MWPIQALLGWGASERRKRTPLTPKAVFSSDRPQKGCDGGYGLSATGFVVTGLSKQIMRPETHGGLSGYTEPCNYEAL